MWALACASTLVYRIWIKEISLLLPSFALKSAMHFYACFQIVPASSSLFTFKPYISLD
jgi:hypothetical protein